MDAKFRTGGAGLPPGTVVQVSRGKKKKLLGRVVSVSEKTNVAIALLALDPPSRKIHGKAQYRLKKTDVWDVKWDIFEGILAERWGGWG